MNYVTLRKQIIICIEKNISLLLSSFHKRFSVFDISFTKMFEVN